MCDLEVLAPVGSIDLLEYAINAGCDAVYLSGKKYGARSFAKNFSDEELVLAINKCHLYGIKVYVTVNTLIYEDEVDDFIDYIDFLHSNGVDAVIMQDIGMIHLVRQLFPNLVVHASTQMNIHNLDGALMALKLGIKRIVVAREVSLDVIKQIKAETNLEVEVFVHGALCVSYSGQCLMSSLIGGRSGNRGSCTGCCRLPYSFVLDTNGRNINTNDYLLSMKDLNTLEYVDKLIEAGVDSVKIEGRMKKGEYVFLSVRSYRNAIDNYFKNSRMNIKKEDNVNLAKMFNRKFTKGFLFGEDNNNIVNQQRPNHMGITIGKVISFSKSYACIKLSDGLVLNDGIRFIGKKDYGMIVTSMLKNGKRVNSASKGDIVSIKCDDIIDNDAIVMKTTDYNLISDINKSMHECNRRISINGKIIIKRGEKLCLEITDSVNVVRKYGAIVSDSINRPIDVNTINKQINKVGNTVFKFDRLDIILDDNVFVNIVDLNNLRRESISELEGLRQYSTGYVRTSYKFNAPVYQRCSNTNYMVRSMSGYNRIKENKNIENIFCDGVSIFNQIDDRKKLLRFPSIMSNYDSNYDNVMVSELGGLNHYNNKSSDYTFNVVNSYSVAILHSFGCSMVTLSYELCDYQIKNLVDAYYNRYKGYPNLSLIVFSYPRVMTSKFNLLKYFSVDKGYLKDRFGNLFRVSENDDGIMYVYYYKKIVLDNYIKYFNMGINNLMIIED